MLLKVSGLEYWSDGVLELFDCGFGIADCGILNMMLSEF
jgi:hypothetical protein